MSFFQQSEGNAAIVSEGGVYKQVDIYTREGFLYAKVSGGFVRLMHDGSTSKAKMRLVHLTWDGILYHVSGKLANNTAAGKSVRISDHAEQLLLGRSS